jgi:hypothetical protein
VATLLGAPSDAANVSNGTAVHLRCSPCFQFRARALDRRAQGSPRPRKWRHRGAVVPTCTPPSLCALSCSPRRADHFGSFIFVWSGRERVSGELRGAHLVGGNGAAVLGLGQASAPPPSFLSRPIRPQRPRLHTPSGLCNRSTVDPWARSTALGRPVHAHSGGPSQPPHATWPPVGQRRGQPRAAGVFAF